MAGIKFFRLTAATILETLVAMVILLTLFGIATTVFIQVTGSTYAVNKMATRYTLNRYIVQTAELKTYFNEEFEEAGIRINKQVEVYDKGDNMVKIIFTVYDNVQHKKIDEQVRLFSIK
ncbi:hypothetical protein [Agriterribacter sp.]|uniref:hypothetical protein n=1 Tax=Agriterribacter sp. TaxID=2821509 RepID=UPI002C85DF47|nr:hypothetical protein [Agriterribacter sp.]HRO44817.1 hypothetical protein [Agriterribacter sp.]HRQ19158.1 hypothetical protein [Agriterribacter sp.]